MVQAELQTIAPCRSESVRHDLPRRLGRYTLVEPLERGGMAQLHVARSADGSVVVVKQVAPEQADDPLLSGLLATEAELTRHAAHPNVVRLLGMGRERTDGGSIPYLVLEHVPGLDLRRLLRACNRRRIALPVPHILAIIRALCRALEHVHHARDEMSEPLHMVHRDVSPANLLIGFDGRVKLCDFGIAAAATAPDLDEHLLLGKAAYMSPEHARGERVDRRADVYAAGIVLWELLSGRRLRSGTEQDKLLAAASSNGWPLLAMRGLPLEELLHAIVRRAMAPAREDRYATAGRMLRDLDGYAVAAGLTLDEAELADWLRQHFDEEEQASSGRAARAQAAPDGIVDLEVHEQAGAAPQDFSRPRRIRGRRCQQRDSITAEIGGLLKVAALSFAAALTSLSLAGWLSAW